MWRKAGRSLSGLFLIAAGTAACGGEEEAGDCEGVYRFSGVTYLVSEPVKRLPLAQEVGTGSIDDSACGGGEDSVVLRRIEGVDPALAVGSAATSSSVELVWVSTDRVESLDEAPPELDPYLD